MPVILKQSEVKDWITALVERREDMIESYDSTDMHLWKIKKAVSSVKNQGAELIDPVE